MESPQHTLRANRFTPGVFFNFLKEHSIDYLLLIVLSSVIIGLDQWSKALVRAKIPLGADWLPTGLMWLSPYARLRHWYNSGAAFGIFQNGNLVFSILAIIVIILIFYYFPRTERNDRWLRVAMIMQLAGAAGNLIDRLFFAHVTDFISVGNFAIFNIADASISTGVAVLLLGIWLKERAEKKRVALVNLTVGISQGQNDDVALEKTEDEAKGG